MMRPYQKNKPWRSKSYLDYIRKQPCVVCGHTSTQAHHVKTVGSGGGDNWAISLCIYKIKILIDFVFGVCKYICVDRFSGRKACHCNKPATHLKCRTLAGG